MNVEDFKALMPLLTAWRRDFHRHPELGYKEHRTSEIIRNELKALGFRLHPPKAQTGVVADWPGSEEGRVLALRADMDALPIHETANHDYRSMQDGVMHACGHDGHVAMLLGFARWLTSRQTPFPGTIRLLFQPAEEGGAGAKAMIEDGALENPKVDAMLGLHLWNAIPQGDIHLAAGPIMAADDQFTLTLHGKGGHGAIPQETVDALVVAAQVVLALQTVVSRNVDPFQKAVLTVGTLHGGSNFNIIAQDATLTGTVRSFQPAVRERIRERFEAIVSGICTAMGATYTLEYHAKYPALVNDEALTACVRQSLEQALGPDRVRTFAGTMGAEDMAYYSQRVPVCYFFLGAHDPAKGPGYPHHHPSFDFDERALWLGVMSLAVAVRAYYGEKS